MLEIKKLRENPSKVIEKLKKRGIDATETINKIIELEKNRISNQQQLDSVLETLNNIAKNIAVLARDKKFKNIKEEKDKASVLKEKSKTFISKSKKIENEIYSELIKLPNTPHSLVPDGLTVNDNKEIYRWGDFNSSNKIIPHWDIAEKLNLIDFKGGAEITGSGFPIYIGKGAKLQRGLINFFLEFNSDAGYQEIIPPFFVNEKSAFNTGQIPDKEGMMYHIQDDNLFAIPTSEVPVTNIYNNKKLKLEELPIKCTAYSPCFRREAGSYGKEVRGLNRLHQFDKVEIVQICEPAKSYDVLEEMKDHVSSLLKMLGLKFRILNLCGGDLGFTSCFTYDFEVFSPAQNKWLEVSSVSNFESFQSNRLKLRYASIEKKNDYCHTLNGSSLALPRIMAAILEHYQRVDKIIIPEALHKFTGFTEIKF
tara:strand:+ start:405 stop:1676 length:1272 start_codon:yes stop_codon:yes gene_type:complete